MSLIKWCKGQRNRLELYLNSEDLLVPNITGLERDIYTFVLFLSHNISFVKYCIQSILNELVISGLLFLLHTSHTWFLYQIV